MATLLRFHRAITVLFAAVALAHAGCSAIIDSSRYVGAGQDSGVPDGEVPIDGEIPIDGEVPNRPPVLSTVALSTYMAQVGDPIRATPGPVSDPDGDTTMVRYQWFRNDTAIDGATSAILATTGFAAGDAIRLEAWAYDGDLEGPRVHAGPVILSGDVTRWRPVMPDIFSDFGFVFYDEPNRRYVRVGAQLLWEYAVDGAGMLHVAPIAIQGTGPAVASERLLAYHDVEGRRVLVFTEASLSNAFVIDLSRRGGESWSSIPVAGIPPVVRFGAATWYQPGERRVWIYGGFNEGETPPLSNELWILDVSAGEERWDRVTLGGTATPPALFGATMSADPTTPGSMILLGGATVSGGGVSLPLDMYRITLGTGAMASMEQLAPILPTGAFGSASATDAANGRIVIAGGASDIDTASVTFGVALFDPEDGTFVRPTSPMIGQGGFGLVHADPDEAGRFLTFRGFQSRSAIDAGFDLRAVDATTGEVTPVAHEDRPPALSEGSMTSRGGSAVLVGGRIDDSSANPIVYQLALATQTWSVVTTMGDAVDGMSPTPRYGNMVFDSSPWTGLQLWSGWTAPSTTADGEVWELAGTRWLHRTLRMGAPPTARRGAAFVAAGACGADQNYLFGGESLGGLLLSDAQTLVCDMGDRMRGCFWEVPASGGTAPSARSWSTMGVDNASTAWLYGGWTGGASSNELFTFNVCAGGAAPWTRATVSGATQPVARHGHSMLIDQPESGGLTSFLVFGGATDGSSEGMLADVWRLEVLDATSARWVEIAPAGTLRPPPRAYHQAVWDEGSSRMIVFGGRDPYDTYGDAWELVVRP